MDHGSSPKRKKSSPKKKKKSQLNFEQDGRLSSFGHDTSFDGKQGLSQQDLLKAALNKQVSAQMNRQLDDYLNQNKSKKKKPARVPIVDVYDPYTSRRTFQKKMSCLKKFVCCELLATLLFCVVLYVLQIEQLWSEKYVDSVVEDWTRNTIEKVKTVSANEKCPADYAPIGQAYFWTIKDGCYCKDKAIKERLKQEKCSKEETAAGCKSIEGSPNGWFDVVNGKKHCAKFNNQLNLMKMHQAVLKDDTPRSFKCQKENFKVCGDPKQDTPPSRVYCVPDWLECPLTEITFDDDGKIQGKIDAALGTPIINLQLSQKGPPCIYNNVSFNTIGDTKQHFDLFSKEYYGPGCPDITFFNPTVSSYIEDEKKPKEEKYSVSETYKEVQSFKGTSEYDLLSDNKPELFQSMKNIKEFKMDILKNYKFKMYEKRYREWQADKCVYTDETTSQKVKITPEKLKTTVHEADYLIIFSYSLIILTGVISCLILLELLLIFKFQNEELSKRIFDCFVLLRRTLSLVVIITMSVGCYLIFNFDGQLITALVDNGCANDKILVATFKSMAAYLESTHSQTKQIVMVSFTVLLGLSCIISIIYKSQAVEKAYKQVPNFGLDKRKSSSLSEPLLPKNDIYKLTDSERRLINV